VGDSVDLLEKGFQLAHFLLADRPKALSVLSGALNKLEAQHTREKKRTYWRNKHLKRWISSITRNDADILQWLILFESDSYEKEEEASGKPSTTQGMIVRYSKHLVRLTTAMSSFHVNVGLSRLLHNYTGVETQRMYELLTERYVGTDQYRRAKNVLRKKLELRFGRFIKSVKTPQGELRFEPAEDQQRWAPLVRECLTAFTPWSTAGVCSVLAPQDSRAGHFPLSRGVPRTARKKEEYDRIESIRCHLFIEPLCYSRLIARLGLRPPEQALALPNFFLDGSVDREDKSQAPPAPPLSPEERRVIEESVSVQAARRRRATPETIKVLVDGVERRSLNFSSSREAEFAVMEGANLVEIWTEENDAPLLLAAHRISYGESNGFLPLHGTIPFEDGAKLVLTLVPEPTVPESTEDEAGRRARIVLRHSPRRKPAAWRETARIFSGRLRQAPNFVWIAVVLLLSGWIGSVVVYRSKLSSQQAVLERTTKELGNEKSSRASVPPVSSYRLIPDELSVRGQAGLEIPVVFVSSQPELVSLQLPLSEGSHGLYKASLRQFSNHNDILSEGLLTDSQTETGAVVVFTIPSSVLKEDVDYTVYLEQTMRAGRREVVNSFTFRARRR
jgi:hypothetical protein